ncbi:MULTISPECIES: 4Fe-4S dicluster domain-containing protein [Diplocloster]|uniref:4Fe-4S dicluster domain-containing protein n=2 Tax=Diplocloster TaxID=2918511 RepID=A0A949K0I2_9FIRM|nr:MULTISPECIES: 4Fe-4S dicluster domain-containing protein [Lachnospiraceae]SCJ68966.1 Iron hydrogenase 1 [uncultured Clostridium sp.]MBU9728911.1 4Fe-4S dicluster domain-containing protein [Diplocloster modestus]MBU9737651.1 4Fe-4S dicluster domain-containing protein [Diplocloster agilis]MBU9744008.1 4Fe-4S dicluster domain-containing protein [Diplocloster agilis]MCU6735252.1 4Fe-4S dicluster domain-containing protein [Suonthocola fibrivorans]
MRGLETPVRKLRHQVFTEVAKVAYASENVNNDIEAIPYKITPGDVPLYRESIYRERAIASERVRLAMGMSLRPEDKPVHITDGIELSNIDQKYYEPPLMQVIPSACNSCADNKMEVSNECQGCIAHPCQEVCPKGAISFVNGKSFIDQEKCIQCGRCKAACPYDAIARKIRPCAAACGIKAIESDDLGRAKINTNMCVSCGQCMVSCPFGAIADKSQLFQLIRCMKNGGEVIAEVAPAIIGQFGPENNQKKVKAALLELGFSKVYEVAMGADVGCVTEAHHYVEKVVTEELPFLLTSCCPSWSMMAKKFFPEMIDSVSNSLTPMVATARTIKQKHPDAKVVFIGPCASKKLEASRRTVRSDVDFVITFEELLGMFDAKGINLDEYDKEVSMHDATGAGRGYAIAGGVAEAIEKCVNEYYPDVDVLIEHAEGLEECKKMLMLAKAGRKNGCLIEGMACPGGCVAGAGTNIPINKATVEVKKFVKASSKPIPAKELEEIELP